MLFDDLETYIKHESINHFRDFVIYLSGKLAGTDVLYLSMLSKSTSDYVFMLMILYFQKVFAWLAGVISEKNMLIRLYLLKLH